MRHSEFKVNFGSVVEDQNECSAHTSQDVRHETFVQTGCHALLCGDLLEAITGALVEVLLWWLLGLHLKTSSDRIEWVCGCCSDGDCGLCCSECGGSTKDTFVGLVGNEICDRVEDTLLQTLVTDKTDDRHVEVGVEGQELLWALPIFKMQTSSSGVVCALWDRASTPHPEP